MDKQTVISYNNIYFTYCDDLKRDMKEVYNIDIDKFVWPMLKHFSQFQVEPHELKFEFSFGKNENRYKEFSHRFYIVPKEV